MSSPDIIVGQISKIDPPLSIRIAPSETRTVYFSDGQFARLGSSNPYSIGYGEILDDTRQTGFPVYIEFDAKTRVITQLRIPIIVTVSDIVRTESGQLLIELEISSACHTRNAFSPAKRATRFRLPDFLYRMDWTSPVRPKLFSD